MSRSGFRIKMPRRLSRLATNKSDRTRSRAGTSRVTAVAFLVMTLSVSNSHSSNSSRRPPTTTTPSSVSLQAKDTNRLLPHAIEGFRRSHIVNKRNSLIIRMFTWFFARSKDNPVLPGNSVHTSRYLLLIASLKTAAAVPLSHETHSTEIFPIILNYFERDWET
jgi:hypothetical protein